jgi:hydroxymethylglutaryl-CoA lyase
VVLRALHRREGVRYPVLVPNAKGMAAAIEARAQEVALIVSASESFSQRNINCSIEQSFERAAPVMELARAHNIAVRGYVSCVLGCPYEGAIDTAAIVAVAARLAGIGCYEISLADTIGVGTPGKARAMVGAVAGSVPIERLAVHFHDTYGQALANVLACLDIGITVVDSAAGGLGGCPYAKGASGNLATEELVYMLDGMGVTTGVDLQRLLDVVELIAVRFGLEPRSKLFAALRPADGRVAGDDAGSRSAGAA